MPAYAMVVVVEAPNPAAMDALRETLIPDADAVLFVGEPWEVQRESANFDGDFDTLGTIRQHPGA